NVNCNGGGNGTASLTVNGGVSPYSYSWSNSATTQNISALTVGTYTVLITDNNGCTQTSSVTITAPSAVTAAASSTNVNCNGGGNGTASLTVNGGVSPYSYSWSNSATTQNISALTAGTYTVLITDNNGCTQTETVIITSPSAITSTSISTDASCGVCADGTVDLTVNGGNPSYTYSWSNSAATEDLNGLLPGTYYVTITDASGCQHTDSVLVNFFTGIANATTVPAISLYPNPSDGQNIHVALPVQYGASNDVSFSLYDISGKEVYHENQISINGEFNFSPALANGSYFYKIVMNSTFAQAGRLVIMK
ncbi:MAG: T9SS type A sorting domain-containing protein, partial [Bacteroidia bacterium]